jgi:hypothetical protein
MKTFSEFATGTPEPQKTSFPTFTEVKEGRDKPCMSDSIKEKINEMMEMCKEEMRGVHADETAMTAESWMSECDSYMKESMESLQKECSECMIQKG